MVQLVVVKNVVIIILPQKTSTSIIMGKSVFIVYNVYSRIQGILYVLWTLARFLRIELEYFYPDKVIAGFVVEV